jgi:hypothetical protein
MLTFGSAGGGIRKLVVVHAGIKAVCVTVHAVGTTGQTNTFYNVVVIARCAGQTNSD